MGRSQHPRPGKLESGRRRSSRAILPQIRSPGRISPTNYPVPHRKANVALFTKPGPLLNPFPQAGTLQSRSAPNLSQLPPGTTGQHPSHAENQPASILRPAHANPTKKSSVQFAVPGVLSAPIHRPSQVSVVVNGDDGTRSARRSAAPSPDHLAPGQVEEQIALSVPRYSRSALPPADIEAGLATLPVNDLYPSLPRPASVWSGSSDQSDYRKPRQPIREKREAQRRASVHLPPPKLIPKLEQPFKCANSFWGCSPDHDWYSMYGKGCCWIPILLLFYIVTGPLWLVFLFLALCLLGVTCQCDQLLK